MSNSTTLFLAAFYNVVLIITTILGVRFGGRDERIGVSFVFFGSLLSVLATSAKPFRFHSVETGIALIDIMVLAAFFVLAMRTKRFWPLWATSFQAAAILTHFSDFLLRRPMPAAYAILQGFFAYPMLMCIMLGVYGYHRAQLIGKAQIR